MAQEELTSLFELHDAMYAAGQDNQSKLQAIKACADEYVDPHVPSQRL